MIRLRYLQINNLNQAFLPATSNRSVNLRAQQKVFDLILKKVRFYQTHRYQPHMLDKNPHD